MTISSNTCILGSESNEGDEGYESDVHTLHISIRFNAMYEMPCRQKRVRLFFQTIHFGSRRPSVRNNVSNKQASALFFQNAFTSWVHHASFLKLCFDQRLLPVVF